MVKWQNRQDLPDLVSLRQSNRQLLFLDLGELVVMSPTLRESAFLDWGRGIQKIHFLCDEEVDVEIGPSSII